MALLIIDWDMEEVDFNAVYELPVGDVFLSTKNYESLRLRLDKDIPDGVTTFKVKDVAPGTPSYSLYGPGTLIVVEKVVVPA